MKQCVIYNCHIINEETISRYINLQNNLKLINIDSFWGIDTNNIDQNFKFPDNIEFYRINDDFLNRNSNIKFVPNYSFGKPLMWTNSNNLLLLTFLDSHECYDFVWQIEYDVCFSGKWVDFFKEFENDTTDFISSNFIPYQHSVNWCWWNECGHELPRTNNWFHSVNVITRMSRLSIKTAKDFYDKYNKNNKIYFEFGLLSSAKTSGLTCFDLTTKYTSDRFVPGKYTEQHLQRIIQNKLYHGIPDTIQWEEFMKNKGIVI